MKNKIALLLGFILCLCLAMPALAEIEDLDSDSEWLYEDDEEYDDELSVEELLALLSEDDGAPITQVNEAQQDDLLAAIEVYSWFALQPLDYDEAFPNADGTKWRVLDERFNTPQLMQDMLSSYFSKEIADSLWNSSVNPYEVIDGFLYTDGEGRGIDGNIGETSIEVTESTDSFVRLVATVEYYEAPEGGQQTEDFEYERKLTGNEWQYTKFPFFW